MADRDLKPIVNGLKWVSIGFVSLVLLFTILGYNKSKIPVSFLPELKTSKSVKLGESSGNIVMSNQWFVLVVDSSGNALVKNKSNDIVLSSLTYYADYDGFEEAYGIDVNKLEHVADSVVIIRGKVNQTAEVTITITIHNNDPRVDFKINTRYGDSTAVNREALIADFDIPVTEIYLKNRQTDLKPLQREYWLDKQGILFGEGSKSALIYNQPDISSIQVDTKRSVAVINLEFFLDHPFIIIPFQEDGGGRWVDRSPGVYLSGDERTDHFSITFSQVPDQVPRLMLVPRGYLAGYIFTEHADAGNLRTHRAAYFGSENISSIAEAKGGFAGHNIPVTKSIFFEFLDGGLSDSVTPEDVTEREYLDFLDQLYATGIYDLCLHTPENSNSNRNYLEKAIAEMKQRYEAASWIDHGMFPGNNNREAFVADGLNLMSEYYAADLWEQFGTHFFWSPAVEAIRFSKSGVSLKKEIFKLRLSSFSAEMWRRYKYRKDYLGESSVLAFLKLTKGFFHMFELNSHQPFNGSALPTPLYWQNVTIARPFYSWTTEYVYHGLSNVNTESQLEIEKHQLDLLVENWGVFFNHGYYVRNGIEDNIIIEKEGELIVNPLFDNLLEYMSQIRGNGDLYVTTVKDLLNYWLLTENVVFEYQRDGSIDIINKNDEAIEGLSLAVSTNTRNILLDGSQPSSRIHGDDRIFWFDIPANTKRTLEFMTGKEPGLK